MPKTPTPIAPHTFKPGDVVKALANTKHVPEGSVGRVALLSATGHPIVDMPSRGRVLMTAAELERHDGPLPKSNPDRVPLRDELPPREIVPVEELPEPDWCEPPDPAYLNLKRATVVQMPRPVWEPAEECAALDSALRNPASEDAGPPAATRQRRRAMSEEGRENIRQARLRRAERERAEKATKEREHDASDAPPQPALAPERAAGTPPATRTAKEEPIAPAAVALVTKGTPPEWRSERPTTKPAPPVLRTIERPPTVMLPAASASDEARAFDIVSTRQVVSLAATRGLGSRTVLELARLLVTLDEEMG